MRSTVRMVCVIGILILASAFAFSGSAQEPANPSPMIPDAASLETPKTDPALNLEKPPIKEISPGVFEIEGIRFSKKDSTVEFPAVVNMDKGLLEYALVGESGKLHESLLRTAIQPYNLQIALLLIGFKEPVEHLKTQGDLQVPTGSPVDLWIESTQNGKNTKLRMEEWIMKKDKPSEPVSISWVFTGSIIMDGVFMAQLDKSLIAIYRDPIALINTSHPEGASDEVWFAREGTVPPVGTEVKIVIQKK